MPKTTEKAVQLFKVYRDWKPGESDAATLVLDCYLAVETQLTYRVRGGARAYGYRSIISKKSDVVFLTPKDAIEAHIEQCRANLISARRRLDTVKLDMARANALKVDVLGMTVKGEDEESAKA